MSYINLLIVFSALTCHSGITISVKFFTLLLLNSECLGRFAFVLYSLLLIGLTLQSTPILEMIKLAKSNQLHLPELE